MFTYEFQYTSPRTGRSLLARLDQDDETINVTIGNIYLGTMVEDSSSPFGFATDDPLLQDELAYFTLAYKEALAIENLPVALHNMYGANLIGWTWTDDQNLKIVAHPDMDLKDFAEVIRDQINEVIMFEKPMTIYLSKEGSGEVKEIAVN